MKRILLMTLLALGFGVSSGQDSLTVEAIDRIVSEVDANKKATKDVYCDDLQLEVLTHYCEETLSGGEGALLYRFTIKTTAANNTLTVYYFHNNELVKVINEERSKSRLLKRRVLYYSRGRVIRDEVEGIHPSHEYFLQTAREKIKEITGQ